MKEYLSLKSIPDKLNIFPNPLLKQSKLIQQASEIIDYFASYLLFTHAWVILRASCLPNITYLTKLNLHSSAARLDCLIRLNYMFTLKTDRKFDIDFYAKYVWISDT